MVEQITPRMAIVPALVERWAGLSLARQFSVLAAAVLLPCSAIAGSWIAGQTRNTVIRNTALATALHMDGLVEPLVPEIMSANRLSAKSISGLDAMLASVTADYRVVSMKIWLADGTIIYSTFPDMIGKRFPPSASFRKALNGELGAEFENEPHVEDAQERATGRPLIEIYAPVRDPATRRIVAVSEFYSNGEQLEVDLRIASYSSWAAVALASAAIVGALSLIVSRGSRVIHHQQDQLKSQVSDLQSLRDALRAAHDNVASSNEQILQRIGADLHDGPAQQLAYALLRLSRIRALLRESNDDGQDVVQLQSVLGDTLRDVRNLSSRLQKPELLQLSVLDVVKLAIKVHRDYTDTNVELEILPHPESVSAETKVCVYRFVQEGLTNAYKHAGGNGQRVSIAGRDRLVVTVSDDGPPPTFAGSVSQRMAGLGLQGMRARIEALGGTLMIGSSSTGGRQLTAEFTLLEQPA